MTHDETESAYYAFMHFDHANAENVLSHYPDFFDDGPVLELACGPGVFLDLLTSKGIACAGVDIDEGMVAQCRERGHDVTLADAVEHLHAQPDNSIRGLFAAHFLEHLPAERVQAVYTEAARVLTDGGVFVAAVPNAACLSVLANDFWRDPTHVRFYDPVALQFFAHRAGLTVTESGGNPRNHPGPPPGLSGAVTVHSSDISTNITEFVLHADDDLAAVSQRPRGKVDPAGATIADIMSQIGHLLSVLNEQNLSLAHQLSELGKSHDALLAELYQPNEVYVVARKVAR